MPELWISVNHGIGFFFQQESSEAALRLASLEG
jgi:hypothetical protein